MTSEKIYVGTELKYHLEITGTGFSIETDDFEVELICGKTSKILKKLDMIIDGQGEFYLPIDTADFPKGGDLEVVVRVFIPDEDFPDGFRTEIYKQFLFKLYKL